MFSKSGGIIWPSVSAVVKQYGEEKAFNCIIEVRDILESRGVFSKNRMYTDQEIHEMAVEELRSILGNYQTEEC